jgi:SNF2 family DNA or RNA helicase
VKLHGYQELARDFLRGEVEASGAAQGKGLFLDLGLGKTATTLAALEERHLPALTIAPKRVAENVWQEERDIWRPDLDIALAIGSAADRTAALASTADLTVVSRDNLKDVRPGRYKTIILDELSSFKGGFGAARWKLARKITAKAEYVWGLTGTPAPNGYLDLWPQIFLLDRGKRLGTSVVGYRNRWFYPTAQLKNGTPINYVAHEGAEEKIRQLIEDICLYMEASDYLPLEKPTFNTIEVPLPTSARRLYDQLKTDLVGSVDLLGDEVFYSASNEAVLSNKLRQIASGFIFSDDQDGSYTELHDVKLDALKEIKEFANDNLLVAYNYIPERERIRREFPEARMLDEPGVYAAWNRGEVSMMLCHPASAGHGLNLQRGGHTVVWASPTWDLELFTQFNGRLARQGQTHPVIVHKLVSPRTIEVVMDSRVDSKYERQYTLLDHLRSPI